MSGHSKWAKIKRQKGAKDTQRGALFTKLARNITIAAQEGGGDPDMNFSLRLAIQKGKEANMPQDNIDRAIKKGTGELKSDVIVKNSYEVVTPFSIGLVVDTSTDNSNRTVSEIKNIVEKAGSKLGESGSVSWQFEEQGYIELGVAKLVKSEKYGESDKYIDASLEEIEEVLLDVDDVLDYEEYLSGDDDEFEPTNDRPKGRIYLQIRTEKSALKSISERLSKLGWQVIESQIIKHPQNKVKIDEEDFVKLERLISNIEDYDDVDDVWHNAE